MSDLINVIGLGYIGLPTALMMASQGIMVVGSDIDTNRVELLKKGKLTFEENGLEKLYKSARDNGIRFTSSYEKANIYVVAVPTPFNKSNKKIVADYLISAIQNIVCVCDDNAIIVVESTISPGTIDMFVRPIVNECSRKNKIIHLAHAPERIIPGNMINELIYNNRTIGVDDIWIGEKIKGIYATFCKGEIELTDIKTAENV